MTQPGSTTQWSRRYAGFSLIELMMVVVVIGVLASIAMPRFAQSRDLAGIRAAGFRFESDIALSLEIAARTSSPHTLSFDLDTDRYELAQEGAVESSPALSTSLASAPFGADLRRVRVNSTAATEARINGHGLLLDTIRIELVRGGLVQQIGVTTPHATVTIDNMEGEP